MGKFLIPSNKKRDGYSNTSSTVVGTQYVQESRNLLDQSNGWEACYGLSPEILAGLVDPKNSYLLQAMGGQNRLASILNTDLKTGLSADALNENELRQRQKVYGRNVIPEKKQKSLWRITIETLNDKVLIILIVAAIISLALGIYESVGTPPEYFDGVEVPKVDYVEGVAILVAVIIVTLVGSLNDWNKERQFAKLNRKKEDRSIEVVREGRNQQVPVQEVEVGDLVVVNPGDILAVDGVLISGYDLKCDESSATGESDTLSKHTASHVMQVMKHPVDAKGNALAPHDKKVDCFMLSGAKVLEGTGTYLATGVGENSMYGRIMMSLRITTEPTALQKKLDRIAEGIAQFGVLSATILFIVLFIRFMVEITKGYLSDLPSSQKGSKFLDIFIVSITVIVVAVPEGLPLAVTLALAFATTRMIKDQNLVRVLKSCEIMGNANTVCSDKTGTLTQNVMTVVTADIGGHEWSKDANEPLQLSKASTELQIESIVLNATAYEVDGNPQALIGSKTESALTGFARTCLGLKVGDVDKVRNEFDIARVVPFDSGRKFMATILRLEGGKYRLLIKGAAEIVLGRTQFQYDSDDSIVPVDLDKVSRKIDDYANRALRVISLVYKDFETAEDIADLDIEGVLAEGLVLLGIYGIQDPLREGVVDAVKQCQRAGVVVRMVTGDNLTTARAIAITAGIFNIDDPDQLIMEGPAFRKLSKDEMIAAVPKLRVLARSSPDDKRVLVEFLKNDNQTVAVTGDGTNDGPALRLADVGFSMGISGTEVAKEASDIIIMDDNFSSIVKALKWGRTVNDAVKKFLQFQLTVNVTAVTLTFISAVANSDNNSVLTAVQLLWVNLIMDTLAALALATDPPTDSILDRPPDRKNGSLITPTMWKMIFGQSIYQLSVTLVLHFADRHLFGYGSREPSHFEQEQLDAMVFNTFVWMQFWNMWVNRRLDNKQNILEGITRNPAFILIMAIIGGFQVLIMFVGGAAFSVKQQSGAQWATAMIAGVLSIPVGMLIRLVPDSIVARCFPPWLVNSVLKASDIMWAGLVALFFPFSWLFCQIARLFRYLLRRKQPQEEPGTDENSLNAVITPEASPKAKTQVAASTIV